LLPSVFERQALEKIFRGDSGPPMKEAVKMELTQSGDAGQSMQIGLEHVVLVQIADDPGYAFEIVHGITLAA